MAALYKGLVELAARMLGPEGAHDLAVKLLKAGVVPRYPQSDDRRLGVDLFGLKFPNPIGLAAGFDKNAQLADAVFRLGFGFMEVGTLTPRPQPGNPKPRVFRLSRDKAVINRLGFNNAGHEAAAKRLARRAGAGIVGVNIGPNKNTNDRIGDYVAGIAAFYGLADYFTINISSPNTPGLRGLQDKANLDELIARVLDERTKRQSRYTKATPVLLKIAPDLDRAALEDITTLAQTRGIDGLIISNTTISRGGLADPKAGEQGGLSGPPLFDLSTRVLARAYVLTDGRLPLIGVGGIDGADGAYAKIRAGASLLQLYTGLVFEGPGLIRAIKDGLADRLERDRINAVKDATGLDARRIAKL